jgi:hypothetical protein
LEEKKKQVDQQIEQDELKGEKKSKLSFWNWHGHESYKITPECYYCYAQVFTNHVELFAYNPYMRSSKRVFDNDDVDDEENVWISNSHAHAEQCSSTLFELMLAQDEPKPTSIKNYTDDEYDFAGYDQMDEMSGMNSYYFYISLPKDKGGDQYFEVNSIAKRRLLNSLEHVTGYEPMPYY